MNAFCASAWHIVAPGKGYDVMAGIGLPPYIEEGPGPLPLSFLLSAGSYCLQVHILAFHMVFCSTPIRVIGLSAHEYLRILISHESLSQKHNNALICCRTAFMPYRG